MSKRAIEESFPIVEINQLAIPERNAFKPIYMMHKWFARRSSAVFRAILLGTLKPAGTSIMDEFYKDHTHDPDTKGIRILDPFMGGGTTIIEALRLGCHVTGVDLSPVAWFIVKTEAETVNIDDLKGAFRRLAGKKTNSGMTVQEELLSHYKTECPCCGAGSEDADIIYTFWVKSAICTVPTCKKEVPLFSDYMVAQKEPTIRYIPDYQCPHCKKSFDLETEPASLIAEPSLMKENSWDAAGQGRGNKRWTTIDNRSNDSKCPWCFKTFKPIGTSSVKKSRKKVPLTVLLCPHCYVIWQMRGTVSDDVTCPVCSKSYQPKNGNLVGNGKFICSCGERQNVIDSIRKLPVDSLLPMKPYAIEGYCPNCAGDTNDDDLIGERLSSKALDHSCRLSKNNGKFFKKITPADLSRIQNAQRRWQQEKTVLPYPKSEIPEGFNTNQMIKHNYKFWYQMFNSRQLLCLATLLKAIDEEPNQIMKEMLLSAFFNLLNNMSDFCTYIWQRDCIRQIFARHDFAPKTTICETSVWGTSLGMGTFSSLFDAVIKGKMFNKTPFDRRIVDNEMFFEERKETIQLGSDSLLACGNSQELIPSTVDYVITDPPYSGNVNYSELADYFYVWLRLPLRKTYSWYSPEHTPKVAEIVENETRGKTAQDYQDGLMNVWDRCYKSIGEDGLLVFTFHHAEGSAWEALLDSICKAGFTIEAVYPIQGESESSLHLQDKEAISYDLIHVCKRRIGSSGSTRSWAGVRQEIRRKAREEIKLIEAGRYGKGQLAEADINLILIGKCLELYSQHYGNIVDYQNNPVPLSEALSTIRMMVEQLVSSQHPLPSELEHIDPVSYVYLTCLCDRKEIKSDEVHKATRGLIEPDLLLKAGVMRKGRAGRGRTYEVKMPDERITDLEKVFGKKGKDANIQRLLFPEMEEAQFDNVALVDVIHYLMGLAVAGDNLSPWLQTFKPVTVPVRVSLEYLIQRNPTFQEPIRKILDLIEV